MKKQTSCNFPALTTFCKLFEKMCEEEDEKEELETESSWQEDIEKRDYYYDDATGYEVYEELDEDDD